MNSQAERFFRDTDYWRAWSEVPDLTVYIDYALRAVRADDRAVLDVPCGRGRLLKAVRRHAPGARLFGLDVNVGMATQSRSAVSGACIQVGSVYAMPFRDRNFDAVLCNESFMALPDRIHLIPNGVDLRRFVPVERRTGQGRVLYIGRLSEEKNLSALVEAAASLRTRVPSRLVMIGAGPLRDTLAAEARAAGVPAEFPGVVDHRLIPGWLRDADAFVLPSFTEGHPKALIEAMAAGVPAIVSDCAGNRAIVKSADAGLLFDPRRPADLAAQLERVLTDDALASELSRRGRDVACRDYDLGRLVQTEIDLLERVARTGSA